MAEFVEVMKQWGRLCRTLRCDDCSDCVLPLKWGVCDGYAKDNADNATMIEKAVMQWAAEHPEPKYGTWGEWFVERGELIEGYENATSNDWSAARFREIMSHPIPADIAEKLGIKPKGGDGDA